MISREMCMKFCFVTGCSLPFGIGVTLIDAHGFLSLLTFSRLYGIRDLAIEAFVAGPSCVLTKCPLLP